MLVTVVWTCQCWRETSGKTHRHTPTSTDNMTFPSPGNQCGHLHHVHICWQLVDQHCNRHTSSDVVGDMSPHVDWCVGGSLSTCLLTESHQFGHTLRMTILYISLASSQALYLLKCIQLFRSYNSGTCTAITISIIL